MKAGNDNIILRDKPPKAIQFHSTEKWLGTVFIDYYHLLTIEELDEINKNHFNSKAKIYVKP